MMRTVDFIVIVAFFIIAVWVIVSQYSNTIGSIGSF